MSDRHAGQVTRADSAEKEAATLSSQMWQNREVEAPPTGGPAQKPTVAEHVGMAVITDTGITFQGARQHGSSASEAQHAAAAREKMALPKETERASGHPLKPTSETVVVKQGDSYWTVAEIAAGKKPSNQDVADHMTRLQKENKFKPLHPGDEIRIH